MEMTIGQVADSLDLPRSTVERWVRQGRIPTAKRGRGYTFDRTTLERWATTHNLPFNPRNGECATACHETPESLIAAMRRGDFFYGLTGDSPDSVLRDAVSRMAVFSPETRAELYARLIDRERMTSTGVGKGIAIPHPRSPLAECRENSMIFTGFPATPLDFRAVDNQPVFVLFILISPSPQCHLRLLSRLAFCARDDAFIDFLGERPAPESIFRRLEAMEENLGEPGTMRTV